jgi:uncharacterized membrane protein
MTTTTLSTATGPIVLISANALFLLTLSNRYSNLTNRLRQVSVLHQAETLYERVQIMRAALFTSTTAIFLQVLVILALLFGSTGVIVATHLFAISLIFVECSVLAFMVDISLSSSAVGEYVEAMRRAEAA